MPRGGATDNVAISFDEEFKVRVLDADKFKQTQELEQECTQFVNSEGPPPLVLVVLYLDGVVSPLPPLSLLPQLQERKILPPKSKKPFRHRPLGGI